MSIVIDAHIHDPDIMRIEKRDPREIARELVNDMDTIGIERALMIALEVDATKILDRVSYKDVLKGMEEAIGYGSLRMPPLILEALNKKDQAIMIHSNHLKRAVTPTERVVKIARHSNNRIIAIGSMRLPADKEELRYRVNGMYKSGVKGIKIYPTLQFLNPSDKKLFPLYKEMISYGLPLFIHTGCDPGFWELPNLCEYANPVRAEKLIKKFPELKVILCHMGAYSAIRPGIFFREAVELAKKYSNVYLDTSAVDPYLILSAIKHVGPEKVIFGTDYPVLGLTWERLLHNALSLNIDKDAKDMIMYSNISRLLGI
jgi:hypothetical protein